MRSLCFGAAAWIKAAERVVQKEPSFRLLFQTQKAIDQHRGAAMVDAAFYEVALQSNRRLGRPTQHMGAPMDLRLLPRTAPTARFAGRGVRTSETRLYDVRDRM